MLKIPYQLFVLLNKLKERGPVRLEKGEFRTRCPAHQDNGPSLYVGLTEDRILLNCKAGCQGRDIAEALDFDLRDLSTGGDSWVEIDDNFEIVAGVVIPDPAAFQSDESKVQATPESDDLRHEIYSELLAQLELSTEHFDDLQRRGLTAGGISKGGYKTADTGRIRKAVDGLLEQYGRDKLLTVPGFQRKDDRVSFLGAQGYLIPVRDETGRVIALKVRHDADTGGPKYTWVSSREVSCGNPVHVPLGIEAPAELVRLTEGELKADVAFALSAVPTVSAPGVAAWKAATPTLKALEAKKVFVAFDQDGNPGTLKAMQEALYGLAREGFDVFVEWWDSKDGKGVDDLLAAGGQPEVVAGLAAAVRVMDATKIPQRAKKDNADPEAMPFPVDVLPPVLARFCQEVAEATATPPDFAGLTMLITAGAAIGNSRALCLKENSWYESPRFYGANVGDPASGKTPAMATVVKPYQTFQIRLLNEYKAAKALYDEAEADYERAVKENRATQDGERRPLPSVPKEPARAERLLTGDATVESLAPLLEENPRGLLMRQDEGVAWVRGMGQYKGGRGNDRQFWLSNWSGDSHLVDRKSQGGVPISIPRPFINVVCGIPPDMLNELADFQGRNDGFLHRILFVFPKATSAADWSEVTVTLESKKAWEATLTGLRKLAMQELDDGTLGYRAVQFAPAAKEIWVRWWNAHAAELRGTELPVQLIGPWGKLRAYAARLALVLHYLWLVQTERDEGDLDSASLERAIRLIDYFKSHLRQVYGRLRQTPEDNHLLEVLDWIRKEGGECTARDLVKSKKVTPTDKAKKVLRELEERGYGRIETRVAENSRRVSWFVFDPE